MNKLAALLVSASACAASPALTTVASSPPSIATAYQAIAAKIITTARADRGATDKLRYLADRIGNRISGSSNLDRAIQWASDTMAADGHDARIEPVMVPHWVRGAESAELTAPVSRPLRILGLGGTIATPKGGITAPVVVVTSWDDLAAKRDRVKGSIVLFNVAMPAYTDIHGSGYGDIVQYRGRGAIEAAKLGAVGVLMRSVTARSMRTPHTGAMRYDETVTKIPAAAVTTEDAEWISRLDASGQAVSVHLLLSGETLPEVPSGNVIGELRGREKPDEIVLIGAHIDSWDVGQGANDDGAGVVMMMQALTTLRKLGLTPRRTIRVVLFTNEENGLHGGKSYASTHASELPKHVLALESDSGGFAPVGFSVDVQGPANAAPVDIAARKQRVMQRMHDLSTLFAPLHAERIIDEEAGADVGTSIATGVPGLGLRVDGSTYFDYHHTDADTFDKVDPQTLADDVAAVAVIAYVVADLPMRLDDPAPTSPSK